MRFGRVTNQPVPLDTTGPVSAVPLHSAGLPGVAFFFCCLPTPLAVALLLHPAISRNDYLALPFSNVGQHISMLILSLEFYTVPFLLPTRWIPLWYTHLPQLYPIHTSRHRSPSLKCPGKSSLLAPLSIHFLIFLTQGWASIFPQSSPIFTSCLSHFLTCFCDILPWFCWHSVLPWRSGCWCTIQSLCSGFWWLCLYSSVRVLLLYYSWETSSTQLRGLNTTTWSVISGYRGLWILRYHSVPQSLSSHSPAFFINNKSLIQRSVTSPFSTLHCLKADTDIKEESHQVSFKSLPNSFMSRAIRIFQVLQYLIFLYSRCLIFRQMKGLI